MATGLTVIETRRQVKTVMEKSPPAPAYCFRLSGTVDRLSYIKWGFGLAILKYLVEAGVIGALTTKFYTPADFLTPLLSHRAKFTEGAPTRLGITLVLWTVPFVWIAVAMSIRRCRDAGYSPWCGMVMLIPLFNYAGMLLLSLVSARKPQSVNEIRQQQELDEIRKSPAPVDEGDSTAKNSGVIAALVGAAAGFVYAIVSTIFTVYVLDSYGAALFFGTPLIAGTVSAWLFNTPARRSAGATILQATLMTAFCCSGFLLVGLEGAICIIMAIPILWPIAVLGALIGRSIAIETCHRQRDSQGMIWCLTGLPLLAVLEGAVVSSPTLAVRTQIDIQAPPDVVWQQVIRFPEITETPAGFFRTGIACPLRARIDGTGVGATRYCEFTTGTFVEPITAWEQNRLLAFDVREQPDPMFELTPYRHIHPPHLNSGFRSTRGEFRLEHLSGGVTRLSGTTWYVLNMNPQAYWTLWSDELVHQIHLRVLNHIRNLAEANAAERLTDADAPGSRSLPAEPQESRLRAP